MSQALYRRYRPETFADVIGQEHVTVPLMHALRAGRANHAYLFSGPRGCGKTTSARILARCLNCEQGPTDTPCGRCESCVALARGGSGSVDVIEIDAASHGGVDDARDLREKAAYGPARSRYKIYIIDEAHMVTPQGFNALLKIVEEPPEHVKFVFATTEPEKVIGTIRSRTHHYPFRLVPPARLQEYLAQLCEAEQVPVEPGVLPFVVRAGGGSVRDSLSVLDQLMAGADDGGMTTAGAAALLGFTKVELLDATVEAAAAGDGASLFQQVDKVIETGQDPRRFAEDLLERLRDLVVVLAVGEGAASVLRGVPQDQLDRMQRQAAAFGAAALSRAADIVSAGLTEMTGTVSPRLHLELVCARLLLPAAAGEQGYHARLDRLERRVEHGVPPARDAAVTRPTVTTPAAHGAPPAGVPSADAGAEAARVPAPAPAAAERPSAPTAPVPQGGAEAASVGAPRRDTADAAPAASVASAAPAPVGPGGVTTEVFQRRWPDILTKISTIRRTTWTLLSTHAQVASFDGRVLTLGIGTPGIAHTFRSNAMHAAYVKEAVLDVLGLEVQVEGTAMSELTAAAMPVEPAPSPAPSAPDAAPAMAVPAAPSAPVAAAGAAGVVTEGEHGAARRLEERVRAHAARGGGPTGIPGEGVDVGAGATGWDVTAAAPDWATATSAAPATHEPAASLAGQQAATQAAPPAPAESPASPTPGRADASAHGRPEGAQGPAMPSRAAGSAHGSPVGAGPGDDEPVDDEPVDEESIPPEGAGLSAWERAQQRVAASAPTSPGVARGVDDESWSTDDESVDGVVDAGPAVITAVLGGTVISDSTG